jgi:nicotinamidase/pyrazinamidase
MNYTNDWLFWNVDTQFDFVSPQGKLYSTGAELIKPNLEKLTKLAKTRLITVVNTADWHYPDSAELSENPDFIKTFPVHCMANSSGAEYIEETNPENPLIFNWNMEYRITRETIDPNRYRNYIIRKDAFDVFKGNRYTEQILNLLAPKTVIVYGVYTNVCVNDAVVGLVNRVDRVIVVQDAIKELPNIPLPFTTWQKSGVVLMKLNEIEKLFQN